MKTNLQPLRCWINLAGSSFKSILLLLLFTAICFHANAVAPVITSFSPTSGIIGTTVTITGTNFSTTPANNSVYFGAVKATVSTSTATTITVTVPAGAGSIVPVSVMVGGLTAYSANSSTPFFNLTNTPNLVLNYTTSSYATGYMSCSVAIGDFNGDGKADLAVVNLSSDNVSVLLGNGAGSFGTATNFAVVNSPVPVAIGDFNGDGKADLVVANSYNNTVSVLLGNGAGSFGTATNFAVGTQPYSVAIGDFNGDGKADLAVANLSSANVSVLLGNGAGSFGAATNFAVGSRPFSITIGDFNGDGKADLAVANEGSNTVSVLLGNGAGSFGAATNFVVGTTPRSVAIGDFNGDGKADLAVGNLDSDNVSILLGNGAGSFGIAINLVVGTRPQSVAIGDFNGDGKADLAVANYSSNNVSVLPGDGTGSFGTTTNFVVGSEPYSLAIGDFNGDGKADLAVANEGSNNVSVLLYATPPAITSATYDAATSALVVTGTDFAALTGAANDIVASKLTLTGEGGATYTLTSANVDITSATQFTISLNTADKAAVNQILNKNGNISTGGTTYNLAAAEDWDAGTLAATVIADLTGNGITVSNVAVPTITSATYSVVSGALIVTGTGFLQLSGASNDIVANKFTFTGESGASYTLTDSPNSEISSGTSFTLTLSATDIAAVNLILNKNGSSSLGGTTYNLAAAEDWDAGADPAVVIADVTGNGITVGDYNNPTITNATYDATTGALVVTGTNFAALTGAANDIVVSKLTITGEGGATRTLTSPNIEISSATQFTVTLNAADKAAVNLIINKNGTSSTGGTTYNLAAAEDWDAGAEAASTIADLTGNGITVSNVAIPTITSAIYNIAAGTLSVTGTSLATLAGSANDIVVSKLTLTGDGGATYTLTSANVDITSAASFTVTLNATDQAAVNLLLNKTGTSSVDGTTYNLAAAEDWDAGADPALVIADLAGNGITVIANTNPTITSATYNAATGALVVTCTNLVAKPPSKPSPNPNDIVVTKLTLTGEGGATRTLTSTFVEISSTTMFTVNLNAADKAAVNLILNKNGTSSTGGTTYNLAAAEDWDAGANAALVIADLTGNGITVSNATSATDYFRSLATGNWSNPLTWQSSNNNLTWVAATLAPANAATLITIKSPNTVTIDVDNQTASNLVIESGALLTIASGKALTVNGTLTNSAGISGLVINSGGSLIESTTGVSATVERAIPANQWHLISAPVSDATSMLFLNKYLQTHTESTNAYTDILPTNGELTPMKGFALWGDDAGFTASFTGTLNAGAESYSTTCSGSGKGWNLVGNPYPSSIDWDAATGWTKNNVNGSIYLHVNAATWATYNGSLGTNGGSRYIAPCQGFFIEASAAGTLGMNNSVRAHNLTTFFKTSEEVVNNMIRLQVSGNGYFDEAVVWILPEATTEFDGQYDARKLLGDIAEAPQIYSLGTSELSINTLPDTLTVPVGVHCGVSGTYTIAATEINDLQRVMLEDTKTGIFTELAKKACTFNFDAGENELRFKLHFSAPGIADNQQEAANIYSYQKTLFVNMMDQVKGDIFIYNIAGQLVASVPSASGMNEIQLPVTGNYIVKVVTGSSSEVKKIFIQ